MYEAESVRRFVGLRLSEPIPDESTILHFRHLLEWRQLGQGLFEEIRSHLGERGMILREGTIVDATIIQAPASTKNREGQQDPEMRQVKKGNQYHFGMKLHIGVDAETGLVHSMVTTPANVYDVTQAVHLLNGEGNPGMGRCWIHWGAETGGEPGIDGTVASGFEAGKAEKPGTGRLGSAGGAGQGIGESQSGTSLLGREGDIPLRQEPAPESHRGYDTGAWPRIQIVWPCCWDFPT